ncbi:hypothetical protein LAX5112_04219 [Roseibium alexandrii]|uniref:Uncharacterized protein n=1 Tax=Roseibium alexandrii TaxID=388408 RepID=A0A0M7ALJ4_9HYPH|nr:hypothetical protein LAX5112_04219 [Roseibium alexandrii]
MPVLTRWLTLFTYPRGMHFPGFCGFYTIPKAERVLIAPTTVTLQSQPALILEAARNAPELSLHCHIYSYKNVGKLISAIWRRVWYVSSAKQN